MLKRFIVINGKSWNSSSYWRLWLLVEKKHLLWGKGKKRTVNARRLVLGNQPHISRRISTDKFMQKL